MMQVLHPTYTLRLEIKDIPPSGQLGGAMGAGQIAAQGMPFAGQGVYTPSSGHKWFNQGAGKTGCDEVLAAVKKALMDAGIGSVVTLERFEHT